MPGRAARQRPRIPSPVRRPEEDLRREISEIRRYIREGARGEVPRVPSPRQPRPTIPERPAPTPWREATRRRERERREPRRRARKVPGLPAAIPPAAPSGRGVPGRPSPQRGEGSLDWLYDPFDEFGQQTPWWQPEWIRGVTGGEPMRNIDFWNFYMRRPRQLRQQLFQQIRG